MTNVHSLNRMFLWIKNFLPGQPIHIASRRKRFSQRPFLSQPLAGLKAIAVGSLCLMCLIGLPAPANAEGRAIAQTTEAIQPLTDSADIAADKVDQFAQAYLQVLQLLSDRESELPAAETSAEALKMQQSIEAEAVERIKTGGLTLPEYMQILGLASQDSAFRDKVLGRMDESLEE